MTAFHPAYRLTVYAPRSVDPTEATVLTPAGGAPHSDQFIVTSIQGIAGSKPYLALPTGRGATIDALNKKTTVGSLTIKILDARVTAGGGNAARWVTAFLGDGSGGNILLGRKCAVEQSIDAGATWAPYFTGRISGPALDGKLWIQLSLRDIADDLGLDLFVGAPHGATSAYAALAQVAPLGLLRPQRTAPSGTSPGTGYAGLPLTTALRGKTNAPDPTGKAFAIDVDPTNGDPYRTVFTQALLDAAMHVLGVTSNSSNTGTPGGAAQPPKVWISAAGAGVYVEYDLNFVATTNSSINTANQLFFTTSLTRLIAKQTNKAGSAAPPATGTSIDFYIVDPLAQPSARTPLLIDDVNPIAYITDLCAGYFGRLDASGTPLRSVPINATSFAAIDTTNFIPWRNVVTKASKLNTELEAICLAYHLAYYVDQAGKINLVDLRRSATTAPVATIADADLDAPSSALAWQQDRESAVTSMLGTYYPEQQIPGTALPKPFDRVGSLQDLPDVPTVGVVTLTGQGVLTAEIGPRSADMKPQTLKVDATGFRFRVDSQLKSVETYPDTSTQSRSDFLRNFLVAYSDEIKGPFGLGPSYVTLVCRRAGSAAAVTQGTYVALTLNALPDPATNQRGGARLGLCVSRTDDGPRISLRILDAGANAVALGPTLGTPTSTATTVSLPVTLNAAAEAVRVSFAATDTTVAVRPADNDPAWIAGPLLSSSSTASVAGLATGQRIWLRARSNPGAGVGFKLPSAWVYPATSHVDLTAISPPTGLVVSGPTTTQQLATWTTGDATCGVDVFLTLGGVLIGRRPIAPTLAPGTTQFLMPPLSGGATYTVGVRHHDDRGAVSSINTYTLVVTTATATMIPPVNPTAFAGSQDPVHGLPQPDGTYGLAVAATEFPGFTEFLEAVETAPGSGTYGAAVTVGKVPNIQGDWTEWTNVAPNDGLRRKLSARHVNDGTTSSAYTLAIPIQPWTAQPLGVFQIPSDIRRFDAFGPIGTGDDTATIQAAIDWSAGGNGEVGQAGTFHVDGLVWKDGARMVNPGQVATTLIPVLAPAAAAILLLDSGPIQKTHIKGLTIDLTSYPAQRGIYFHADPILVDGVVQGGLWYSTLEDIQIIGGTKELLWLHGGDDSHEGPHQWLKLNRVVCLAAAGSTRPVLRMSGQVGQVEMDASCRFDGIDKNHAGVNILIERTVSVAGGGASLDAPINNGDIAPYTLIMPVTCQSRVRLVTVERAQSVYFDYAHFEEAQEGVFTDVSTALVSVRSSLFGNVGHNGGGTGWAVKSNSGLTIVGKNAFGGTVDTHYVRASGGSLVLEGGDYDTSGIRTSGVTLQVATTATIVTGWYETSFINGGSATAITTITSQVAVGKFLTLRANAGQVIFKSGGNIDLGGRFDPLNLPSGASLTLVRNDLTGTWQIVGVSGPQGGLRGLPIFVNAAASPYSVLPGSGTIRVDASAGAVTIKLAPIAQTPPGERVSVKKIDSSANKVFINGNVTAENPDGQADNIVRLVEVTQAFDFERNSIISVGAWDTVASSSARSGAPGTVATLTFDIAHFTTTPLGGSPSAGGIFDGSTPLTLKLDATPLNTVSTLVARDANGDFAMRNLSAANVAILNASTALFSTTSTAAGALAGQSIVGKTGSGVAQTWIVGMNRNVVDGRFSIEDTTAGFDALTILPGAGDASVRGKLGIGGATPTFNLDILISGSANVRIGGTAVGAGGTLQLADGSANNAYTITTLVGGSNDGLQIKRASAVFVALDNTGKMGLGGVTAPAFTLDVTGTVHGSVAVVAGADPGGSSPLRVGGNVNVLTTGGVYGLTIADSTSNSGIALRPHDSSSVAFWDNIRVGSANNYRTSVSTASDTLWLTVTAAGVATFAFDVAMNAKLDSFGVTTIHNSATVTGTLSVGVDLNVTGVVSASSFTGSIGSYSAGSFTVDLTHAVTINAGGSSVKVAVVT